MSDPYKVLGISPSATDEEVKTAYREMAKKYHPDNYSDSPLSDLAAEKMKEINEAYDAIIAERKQRSSGQYAQGNTSYGGYYGGYQGQTSSNYFDARNMIASGRIADAEQILNGVPQNSREAEWYFLKGTIYFRKGWSDDAYTNFQTACQMDPSNSEYRAAFNNMNNQRNGMYGGYNTNRNPNAGGCNGCDMCSGLICADCCCECTGGDLIPCC